MGSTSESAVETVITLGSSGNEIMQAVRGDGGVLRFRVIRRDTWETIEASASAVWAAEWMEKRWGCTWRRVAKTGGRAWAWGPIA